MAKAKTRSKAVRLCCGRIWLALPQGTLMRKNRAGPVGLMGKGEVAPGTGVHGSDACMVVEDSRTPKGHVRVRPLPVVAKS